MDANFAAAIKLRPDYAQSYYQRAFTYKDRGLCKKAIADFTQVIKLKEANLLDKAYMNSAQCREAINDYRGAIADWTGLLQSVKRWSRQPVPDINEARGLAYFKVGQRKEAFQDLRLVLRLKGKYAVPTFTKMIKWKPKDPAGYVFRGQAYTAKRDYDRAIADFSRAIAIQPQNVTAYILRGKAYTAKKDHDGAIADFTRVIEIQRTPIQKITTYIQRGKAYTAKKDYVRALADFDWVIGKYPKAWIAIADRARTHELQGNTRAAIRDLKEALRLKPKNKQLTQRLKALTSNAKSR